MLHKYSIADMGMWVDLRGDREIDGTEHSKHDLPLRVLTSVGYNK